MFNERVKMACGVYEVVAAILHEYESAVDPRASLFQEV